MKGLVIMIDFYSAVFIVAAAICAMLISFSATPPVRVLAYKIGAIDVPLDMRRMHKKPIPRIGGLAIYIGFIITSAIFCEYNSTLLSIWIGGTILVFIGILDDVYCLPALLKLFVQIIVAFVAVMCGVTISYVTLFGHTIVFGIFEIPVTVIWIVALTNAINLIDGLDGLACGVSAICSASISFVMLIVGDVTSALVTIILTSACVGFIPFNKNPAKIFMGDTGSLFLGFSLAVISAGGLFKLHTAISFLVPITVFALPLFDTCNAVFRRILSGRSPFSPDKGHLHHKLVGMGFSQKESVKILYAICALMGLVAVVFTDTMSDTSRLGKAIALLIAAVVILLINYIVMMNPVSRFHSGLFESEDEEEYRRLARKVDIIRRLKKNSEDFSRNKKSGTGTVPTDKGERDSNGE